MLVFGNYAKQNYSEKPKCYDFLLFYFPLARFLKAQWDNKMLLFDQTSLQSSAKYRVSFGTDADLKWLMRSWNETFFTSDAPPPPPGLVFAVGFLQDPRSQAISAGCGYQAAVVLLSCSTQFWCLWERGLGPTESLLPVCPVLWTTNDAALRYPRSPSPIWMKID